MKNSTNYITARDKLLEYVFPVGLETIPLSKSTGRILGFELKAIENVPSFDRSPYDGYAVRSVDTANASKDNPITLKILEEIPAGSVSTMPLTEGTAAKILTGSPIPEGADAVIKFEVTDFSQETVTIYAPVEHSANIIYAGEDVVKGTLLASQGTKIDDGLAGTLAAQSVFKPLVYKKPVISIISTGSELLEEDEDIAPGKIRNSSRYTLTNALERLGCIVNYLGIVKDCVEAITDKILIGLSTSDMVILTGGVSVGDYDLTPAAMDAAGINTLVRGVGLKPGMACAIGEKSNKLVCGLSGNPASAIAVYFTVLHPCVRKLAGYAEPIPQEFDIEVSNGFNQSSKNARLLRGKLLIEDGKVKMVAPQKQGNVMIGVTIGCDVGAIVPAGSGKLAPGTVLKGFLL